MDQIKALSLISAGIDSPVATWIMKEKGLDIIGIHFSNEPLAPASPREMTVKICRHLGLKRIYIIKHGILVQTQLMKKCQAKMRCVLCRRMMLRISERIAVNEGCKFLITGENLGQVASQTLENMTVAASAVRIPILRPLLCNDKQDNVDIAIKIGTYVLSVEAAACCNAVPKDPITKSIIGAIEREERQLDMDKIVEDAVSSAIIIDL